MTHPEMSNHQPLEELLEICDEEIAHSSIADLGNVVQKCCLRLSASVHASDQRLNDLPGCLELLELDRRTQQSRKEPDSLSALGWQSSQPLRIERFRIEQPLGVADSELCIWRKILFFAGKWRSRFLGLRSLPLNRSALGS